MPSRQEKIEIKKLMRRIKDATDNNMDQEEIESRVGTLYDYLIKRGYIQPEE